MDPARKRQIRLVVALSAAVLLSVALIYTSFSAANEALEPSEVTAGSGSVDVSGKVTMGSVERTEGGVDFEIEDREGESQPVPVTYLGVVPDPFREGREVIVTGELNSAGVFVAEKDSLVTKCPSKFKEQYGEDNPNLQYED
jgi:cytochrome c-type biogenesis protein CcmE